MLGHKEQLRIQRGMENTLNFMRTSLLQSTIIIESIWIQFPGVAFLLLVPGTIYISIIRESKEMIKG